MALSQLRLINRITGYLNRPTLIAWQSLAFRVSFGPYSAVHSLSNSGSEIDTNLLTAQSWYLYIHIILI